MLPVVKLGRIAGQFAKPRSSPTERVDGVELPSFCGHMVQRRRSPTPRRACSTRTGWCSGYHQSASTLNLLRAFTKGGFADITRVHEWNQEFVALSAEGRRYEQVASDIERALRFMTACGIDLAREAQLHEVDVWTSHEGLVLDYEEGLTRRDSLTGDWYDCSAHMLWIGERTRPPTARTSRSSPACTTRSASRSAPAATAAEVIELSRGSDPRRTPGAPDADRAHGRGPGATRRCRRCCAPCARGEPPGRLGLRPDARQRLQTASGLQDPPLRRRSWASSRASFAACRSEGAWPGGVHLEFTGEDVTECLGGAEAVLEEQLEPHYVTLCDPRLNARQSLDLAFRLAELLRGDARPA